MIPSYPSPQQVGHRNVRNIFDGHVVVQEKVDGSQIAFCVDDQGDLRVRSRGGPINVVAPDKMFGPAVAHLLSVKEKIPKGVIFRGECVTRPRHNVLAYDRVPTGYIALFDVQYDDGRYADSLDIATWADVLGLEAVPVIYEGTISSPEALRGFLDRTSFLGGAKIEGVVVKNYALVGSQEHFAAKFVSEEFKEIHIDKMGTGGEKRPKEPDLPIDQRIINAFKTTARWQKARQHLREEGRLTDTPKDIGAILKEVQTDIIVECGDEIKELLWQEFQKKILAGCVDGLALWYKDVLLKESFASDPTP
jgi:hypothetical protein